MHVTAAQLTRAKTPFEMVTLDIQEPREHEVLVAVAAAGLGHADVLAYEGKLNIALPVIPGCEGAGSIVRAGSGVDDLAPGDRVVLTRHAGRTGESGSWPGLSSDTGTDKLHGGERPGHSPFDLSLFATHVVVPTNNVVRVVTDLPWSVLAALGGDVLAGASIIMNTLRPVPGCSLAIFGAGAMGLGALMAAQLAGCQPVIAIDFKASRLQLAESLGATMTIDPDGLEPVEAIRGAVDKGVEFSVDTTGVPSVARQAVDCLGRGGKCVLSAMAADDAQMTIGMNVLFDGRMVGGGLSGAGIARALVPRLIDFHRRGWFPIDQIVQEYPFAAINQAVADIVAGAAVKPVLVMHPSGLT
jgi:aryl-alcohol dehydrogenase